MLLIYLICVLGTGNATDIEMLLILMSAALCSAIHSALNSSHSAIHSVIDSSYFKGLKPFTASPLTLTCSHSANSLCSQQQPQVEIGCWNHVPKESGSGPGTCFPYTFSDVQSYVVAFLMIHSVGLLVAALPGQKSENDLPSIIVAPATSKQFRQSCGFGVR